jgi:hypothetical protein
MSCPNPATLPTQVECPCSPTHAKVPVLVDPRPDAMPADPGPDAVGACLEGRAPSKLAAHFHPAPSAGLRLSVPTFAEVGQR